MSREATAWRDESPGHGVGRMVWGDESRGYGRGAWPRMRRDESRGHGWRRGHGWERWIAGPRSGARM